MKQDQEKQHELIDRHLNDLGKNPEPDQVQKLLRFSSLVLAWTQKVNLVAESSGEAIIKRHILNSINMAIHLGDLYPAGSVLDIGSGGGFPGVPMKLLSPGREFTLVDSNQKKIFFLNSAIRALSLEGINTAHVRLKTGENRLGGLFEVIVARAVAPLGLLVNLAEPLLAREGKMFFLKGATVQQEIRDLERAGRKTVHNIQLRSLDYLSSGVYREQSWIVEISNE